MRDYWAIAPYHADEPDDWEQVWRFDLEHGMISIGWARLGDVSALSEDELLEHVAETYECSLADATPASRMVYKFYHSVKVGDVIVARRGRKCVPAVGLVSQ